MLPFKSKPSKVYTDEAMTLTVAVRRICEAFGRRRSISTIKRAVSYPYETFGPKEACFALGKLGFKSQVSDCPIKDINETAQFKALEQ